MSAGKDWKRLADRVVSRREELSLHTRQDLADATGLSYRLLGDLERGVRGMSEGTLALVEQALGWSPGSAHRILNGGDPLVIRESVTKGHPVRPSEWNDSRKLGSAVRAMADAYKLAAEISEAGDGATGDRLLEILGDIAQSLTVNSATRGEFSIESFHPDTQPIAAYREVHPTISTMVLGRNMRRLRETAGMTPEQVSARTFLTTYSIHLLELGKAVFSSDSLSDLLNAYKLNDPGLRQELFRIAEDASHPGWWARYTEIMPAWFKSYISLEQCARIIRTHEAQFVPGLLQTAAYARAVIGTLGLDTERRVEMRIERQKMLSVKNAPKLWAVIDESALRRQVGGPEVLRGQIEHLIEAAKMDNIVIQILPTKRVANEIAESFSLLRFNEKELPDLVYIEQLTSALYMEGKRDVQPYTALMDRLCVMSYTPEQSTNFLYQLRDQYSGLAAASSGTIKKGA
ncbi:XRE family transcriptional regulator [Nocardia colli]|uniref:XRE family transcriptional regulator n=1 Tax=Nocardia colli TaxID=2545717 RepID=A0A5N0E9N6_9NOCA|nr:Scr1 family TA system antitoxin-like transcriptional regulator [Nocardia colli]KAA8884241.1 XRE family transcriptional regulator [Nocardia colli]